MTFSMHDCFSRDKEASEERGRDHVERAKIVGLAVWLLVFDNLSKPPAISGSSKTGMRMFAYEGLFS